MILIIHCSSLPQKLNEYDLKMPQSQITDRPMAPRGRDITT